jgi:hypothetical protein
MRKPETVERYCEKMIEKHGAWSLFRVGFPGGTLIDTMTRGTTLEFARKMRAAALQAVFTEANGSKRKAAREFRKAVNP